MQKSHFSLTWDKFHSSMCAGFSLLQQNGELVDMTLAADGHMVKVHQIVLGVASPFIKELLQSVDCKHPIIFLNNVSYPVLCNILEYVYTGEVSLSEENLGTFFSTAKALLIRGLEEMTSTPGTDASLKGKISSESQTTLPTTLPSQIKLPTKFIKILPKKVEAEINPEKTVGTSVLKSSAVKHKIPDVTPQPDAKKRTIKDPDVDDGSGDDSGGNQDETVSDDFELTGLVESSQQTLQKSTDSDNSTKPLSEMQYTVSNRGCLQLILNRFLYNLYSRSSGGRIRRWRCVDYRDHRCPAAATTDNNVIVRRSNLHNHPFHDKKILAKIDKKAVFSAIKAVSNSTNPVLE